MRVASFDIFDTCLVRKCGSPENLLDYLSTCVFTGSVDERIRQKFILERSAAQQNAEKRHKEKASLSNIYECFDYHNNLLIDTTQIEQKEIECESRMLVSVWKVKQLIDIERCKGSKIIFISDMYLPRDFIETILLREGLLQKNDAVYISNEVGKTKRSGELFEFVKNQESISYNAWTHYGDNSYSDITVPRQFGISTIDIKNRYLPLENNWLHNYIISQFPYNKILAGLSRSAYHAYENHDNKSFCVDIIAPLYCSFVCMIFEDAKKRGINKLFFCARDAYFLYIIAKEICSSYQGIDVEYLFISRDSLYGSGANDLSIGYFAQIGLASRNNKCAIVDVRSTGRTLKELNFLLQSNSFNNVYGYYFEMFCDGTISKDTPPFYSMLNKVYAISQKDSIQLCLLSHWQLYEMYFAPHFGKRTVSYQRVGELIEPVFEIDNREEARLDDSCDYAQFEERILTSYARSFVELKLYQYSNFINNLALNTLFSFLDNPNKEYLSGLSHFYIKDKNGIYKPFIKKVPLFYLFLRKPIDSVWNNGSIVYSSPSWLLRLKKIKRLIKTTCL